MTLGARERISLLTRRNWAFEMMPGNAFSSRTGSALSFAVVPQTRVPVRGLNFIHTLLSPMRGSASKLNLSIPVE